jgi:hypothetical protein
MITAPIILTGGGKFPFVDGVPQLYTREQFEDCCCPQPPAPDTCPCTDWPPAEWPCGDMVEEYAVSFEAEYVPGQIGLPGEVTLTRGSGVLVASSTSCRWEYTGNMEFNTEGQGWEDYGPATGSLRLETWPIPRWVFNVGVFTGSGIDFEKLTGLTPPGSYQAANLTGVTAGTATVS